MQLCEDQEVQVQGKWAVHDQGWGEVQMPGMFDVYRCRLEVQEQGECWVLGQGRWEVQGQMRC